MFRVWADTALNSRTSPLTLYAIVRSVVLIEFYLYFTEMKIFIKNNLEAGILLLVLFFLFLSCKKSDDLSSLPNSFSWTFNGTEFKTILDSGYHNFSGDAVIIAKSQTDPTSLNERILIILPSFIEGTYTFGTGLSTLQYVDQTGNTHYAVLGSLVISRNQDKLLTGSFSATLTSNVTIVGNFTNTPTMP